jgi:hypothetical protein
MLLLSITTTNPPKAAAMRPHLQRRLIFVDGNDGNNQEQWQQPHGACIWSRRVAYACIWSRRVAYKIALLMPSNVHQSGGKPCALQQWPHSRAD